MRSTKIDDRTAKARIRDAAIHCYAKHGVGETTVRKVAASAGVSPGLVIHHFGSMEGLRSACDEHVAATIRQYKHEISSVGPGIDVLAAVQKADFGSLAGYLAAVLVEDSPTVAKLVDDLFADAEVYLQQFVETGMVRPTADPRGRAAVLMLWSLGALVMHKHVRRILGVDLTDPEVGSSSAIAAYAGPAWEIMGEGIFTESFAASVRDSLAGTGNEERAETE